MQEDRDLQRIETFVQLTVSKLPGQPPPRADAGRGGSRYQPVPAAQPPVKSEQVQPSAGANPTMVTSNGNGNSNGNGGTTSNSVSSNGSGGSTPQFIDIRDYQTESSSEVDTREVNPMDELSDFESETSQREQQQKQGAPEVQQPVEQVREREETAEQEQDHGMDVEMEDQDEDEALEDVEEQQTACEICKSSERENEILLCDDCDAEYHIYCLNPPLPKVPETTWYCPTCRVKYPAWVGTADAVNVKEEQARTTNASVGTGENAMPQPVTDKNAVATNAATVGENGRDPASSNAPTSDGQDGNDPTSISIGQALESNPEKSNLLLIHACNCDEVKCTDPEFHVFCPHMKRFLRSVCWASHSDKWRSYQLARITAELFAYHAMNCQKEECNVPLCVKIREEEIV